MKRLVIATLLALLGWAALTARAWWPLSIQVVRQHDDPYLTEPWGDC